MVAYRQEGFTLIEIAIVMVILGILVGGGIPLLRALTEQKKRNETISYMTEIRNTLIGFTSIHGRFPWADRDNDGIEDPGSYYGYLPYVTLGVKPVDSYSRHLKYEINRNLGADRHTTCTALKDGLSGYPRVVDSDATPNAFSVAAVIVSAGSKDADNDGNVFDKIGRGSFRGDNTDGRPNYIRYPPVSDFDDIVRYLGGYETYTNACEFLSLAVNNNASRRVYVYNATRRADLGSIRAGGNALFDVLSGSRIEIRDMPRGGGRIVNSQPPTPVIISGTGATIYVGSQGSGSGGGGGRRIRRPVRRR